MYTILIVDDERPAQTFLKAICQKYCPAFDTILLSGSADDALRLMAQQHVHVLVTDISMPGINGIELAQRVRQLYPRTHTVIVSGYAEFEFARGAIQAGVDDFICSSPWKSRVSGKFSTESAKRSTRKQTT